MFKRTIKGFLITVSAIGFVLTATAEEAKKAEVTVNGALNEYLGQYDSGVEGEKAHLENRGDAWFTVTGTYEKFISEIYAETDSSSYEVVAYQKLSYISDVGLFSLGNVENYGAIPFTNGGGAKSYMLEESAQNPGYYAGYTSADGFEYLLPLGAVNIQMTMYPTAAVEVRSEFVSSIVDEYNSEIDAVNAEYGAHTMENVDVPSHVDSGQTYQLSIFNREGPVQYTLAYTSETNDNWNDATPDAVTNTYMLVGAKFVFGKMAVALDYVSAEMDLTEMGLGFTETTKINTTTAQFSMEEVGPGTIFVTYGTETIVDMSETIVTNLVYDIPLDTASGLQLVYLANTATPDDAVGGDAVTSSFMGAGFYSEF
jgi:hypothetical protein